MVPSSIPNLSLRHPPSLLAQSPVNFPKHKKVIILVVGITTGFNANLGSSLPSGAISAISQKFNTTDPVLLALLNSIYLLGYAFGPLLFGPLSEHVGRRPVIISSSVTYTIATICCALSPTYGVLLLFRFFAGVAAAAPIAVVAPLFADIFEDSESRGTAIASFILIGVIAPEIGPLISGYTGIVSWNLPFWAGAGVSGLCLPLLTVLPETCASVLQKKALRKVQSEVLQTLNTDSERSKTRIFDQLKVVFSRPFTMLVHESIVLFTSFYCAFVYAILFLFFQAYPIIFQGIYGFSSQRLGLTFLPISGGCVIAFCIAYGFDRYRKRARMKGAIWATKEEYCRLPLACCGGPAVSIALLWLGWSSRRSVEPVAPVMSGLLFGIGYLLIFMAMTNYLSDAYKQYAAPAQAASSTTRSLVGVGLPLAAAPMFKTLGVQWACSLLAFIMIVMSVIPFIFIMYGPYIRKRSPISCEILQREVTSLEARSAD